MRCWIANPLVCLFLSAVWVLSVLSGCRRGERDAQLDHLPFGRLWDLTTHSCIPEYPSSSLIARREGVAVVLVRFDTQGRLTAVRVLEAPDEAIWTTVQGCASRWRIAPDNRAKQVEREGKLFFYFVIGSNQSGKVLLANRPDHRKDLTTLSVKH